MQLEPYNIDMTKFPTLEEFLDTKIPDGLSEEEFEDYMFERLFENFQTKDTSEEEILKTLLL